MSDTLQATDSANDNPKKTTQSRQKKRKPRAQASRSAQKKLKISKDGAIAVDNESEHDEDEMSNKVNNDERVSTTKKNRSVLGVDEIGETSDRSRESPTFVDLSNVCLFDDESPPQDISSSRAYISSDPARVHNQNPLRTQTQVKIIIRSRCFLRLIHLKAICADHNDIIDVYTTTNDAIEPRSSLDPNDGCTDTKWQL